jgi:hypothetical protein
MRRPFGCHYRVHVRHSVHLPAQERITVLYPRPTVSWMIPLIAKEAK